MINSKIFQSIVSGGRSGVEPGVYWDPLLLVMVLLGIAAALFLLGKLLFRGDYNRNAQVKPYNSGALEEMDYSVKAQNLYWGFRKSLELYYEKLEALHNGDLNDYIKWFIITMALCFLLIVGGVI